MYVCTVSNRLSKSIAEIGKFTAMIILYFDLQPQFKIYELFHVYLTKYMKKYTSHQTQ